MLDIENMAPEHTKRVLDAHGITHVTSPAGVVMAREVATRRDENDNVVDASSWIPAPTTMAGLAEWLGY